MATTSTLSRSASLPTDTGSSRSTAPARTGAEAIVQLLVASGVDYVFLNPGTDTAPIQEALVALAGDGERVPTLVPCLYENVAMAAAHGYFLVTHKPQLVVVHVDVGTQNLGGNVHDAMRGQAGVVILAGRAPYTVDGRLPGSRDRAIQWQQDVTDQIGIVRNYVKWAHELGRVDTLHQLVPRAVQMAASEPWGPVYMTAAREVLMQPPVDNRVDLGVAQRARPLVTSAGDPGALDQLAEWLAEAEAPLAIAGNLGRHPEAVNALVTLAETVGMRLIDTLGPLNVPADHPLSVDDAPAAIAEADVVLLLDVDVPWIPRHVQPAAGARIAQLDIDPLKETMALWGFPVDLPIQADTSKALVGLQAAVERHGSSANRQRWAARRERYAAARQSQLATLRASLPQLRTRQPIALEWVGAALAERLPEDAIVLDETVTSADAVRRFLGRQRPGSVLAAGAPGLGWALGASVGVRLAAPEQTVVALVGDGSFVFGSPIAALWAAQQAAAPFLTIIMNNGGYNASKMPVLGLFPDGASQRANAFPGVRFNTPPDYAALARSCHAYGERVERAAELPFAIDRGLAAVASGQAAVLDVLLAQI
ncbi:MAG: thiamine pyrophosphate-requiring protein [Chloroflexi bacterium]|nr:thiamine pyrophosphate-requiring protein [Chloroflexota bacterium]